MLIPFFSCLQSQFNGCSFLYRDRIGNIKDLYKDNRSVFAFGPSAVYRGEGLVVFITGGVDQDMLVQIDMDNFKPLLHLL